MKVSDDYLLNQKLDSLLIQAISGSNKSGITTYNCLCDCGKEVVKSKSTLTTNSYKSCGCTRLNNGKTKGKLFKLLDEGDSFGEITIVSFSHMQGGRQFYKTKCSCGTEKLYDKYRLTSGNTKSCGCKKRAGGGRPPLKTLVGSRFGDLEVLSIDPNKVSSRSVSKNFYLCKCSCGNVVSTYASCLIYDNKTSCGCKNLVLSRNIRKDGYVELTGISKQDPYNNTNSCRMAEHRYVMAQKLGRPLLDNENVHHINGIRSDNSPDNLELWVKSQPCGQRVDDLVEYAKQVLMIYSPESLVT